MPIVHSPSFWAPRAGEDPATGPWRLFVSPSAAGIGSGPRDGFAFTCVAESPAANWTPTHGRNERPNGVRSPPRICREWKPLAGCGFLRGTVSPASRKGRSDRGNSRREPPREDLSPSLTTDASSRIVGLMRLIRALRVELVMLPPASLWPAASSGSTATAIRRPHSSGRPNGSLNWGPATRFGTTTSGTRSPA